LDSLFDDLFQRTETPAKGALMETTGTLLGTETPVVAGRPPLALVLVVGPGPSPLLPDEIVGEGATPETASGAVIAGPAGNADEGPAISPPARVPWGVVNGPRPPVTGVMVTLEPGIRAMLAARTQS
jgi:hypothetical protein